MRFNLQHVVLNSPGFGQRACQIISNNFSHLYQIEATNLDSSLFQLFDFFWYQPFPSFRIVFETFAIEANSSSHFRAFFAFRSQLEQPFPIRARFELNLSWIELELNWIELNSARPRGGGLHSPGLGQRACQITSIEFWVLISAHSIFRIVF